VDAAMRPAAGPARSFVARSAATRDGVPYRLRAIRTDDAARERAFIVGLSDETLYNRLMYALREPTPQFIRSLVEVDQRERMAIVATLGGEPVAADERIIGVARYATDRPGAKQAEFAVTIADAWQGRGIGRTLLIALIDHARGAGLARLYGTILATNVAMIELAHSLGMHTSPTAGNAQVVEAQLRLVDA
jgi:acetyltransferase